MVAAVGHLGRPLYAFRALIGLRTSWLSREILAFGLFAGLAAAYGAEVWLRHLGVSVPGVRDVLQPAAALAGLAGVFCSVMIYVDTRRAFWNLPLTGFKFFMTGVVLGVPAAVFVSLLGAAWSETITVAEIMEGFGRRLLQGLVAAALVKLAIEALVLTHLRDKQHTPLKRTALLLTGELAPMAVRRVIAGVLGGIVLPGLLLAEVGPTGCRVAFTGVVMGLVLVFTLLGELLERHLFFTAAVAPRCRERWRHERTRRERQDALERTPRALIRQRDGKLTRELLLAPGQFGLGKVPASRLPDATTTMVCGYCSTGCGLDVHLKEGAAIGLTPATDYPVNLGMACPKGWEALTVLSAGDRATTPLARNALGRLEPVDWETALRIFCDRFQAIQAQHGPESVAFLSTGQIVTEEMALLGAWPSSAWGSCTATATPGNAWPRPSSPTSRRSASTRRLTPIGTSRNRTCLSWSGRTCASRTRSCGSGCAATPTIPGSSSSIRARPRRRWPPRPHLAIRPKSDLTLFYGVARILIREGWIDGDFIDAHTTGFEEFKEFLCDYPMHRVTRCTGLSERQVSRVRPGHPRGPAGLVLVDDGREPEP